MSLSIRIVGIGNKKEILNEEMERYNRLLRPYTSLSTFCLKAPSGSYANLNELLEREAKVMYGKWPAGSYTVALSAEGTMFDSVSFARWLQKHSTAGAGLLFNIGSAHGLSDSLKEKCREVISLSPMTFPHRLCYILLVEQIYRACTILKGHPYHK